MVRDVERYYNIDEDISNYNVSYVNNDNIDFMIDLLSDYELSDALDFDVLSINDEEKWIPKIGELYYFYDISRGLVDWHYYNNDVLDRQTIRRSQIFKNKIEAQKYGEILDVKYELQELADKLNNGEKIDWSNSEQEKYYLIYDNICEEVDYKNSFYMQIPEIIYCLDKDFKDKAIEKIGKERLIKYLKGEVK